MSLGNVFRGVRLGQSGSGDDVLVIFVSFTLTFVFEIYCVICMHSLYKKFEDEKLPMHSRTTIELEKRSNKRTTDTLEAVEDVW